MHDVNAHSKAELRKVILHVALSSLFAVAIMLVPWEELQTFAFVDRENYRFYFLYQQNRLEYQDLNSILDYVKNEAVWHHLISYLGKEVGLSIEAIFSMISFLCLSTFSYFLLSKHGIWSLFLLLNPLLITLCFSQLRIALAFSLVLLTYLSKSRVLLIIALVVCSFIHTGIAVLAAIAAAIWAINRMAVSGKLDTRFLFSAYVFLGLAISVAIGPFAKEILSYFGDRRADIYIGDASTGIKYTLFWIGLLGVCGFQRVRFHQNLTHAYTIVILSLVTFNLFTGGYSSRFIAISLPMLMSTILDLRSLERFIVILTYLAYLAFAWIYWSKTTILS